MRRTRSRVAQVKTAMQEQEDTLQAVAPALATGSMPFDSSGLGQKWQGPGKTVTWDVGTIREDRDTSATTCMRNPVWHGRTEAGQDWGALEGVRNTKG